MDGDGSTTGASDGHQGGAGAPASGSTVDGSSGGTQPTGDTFSAERQQFESRVRSEQGRADKAEARIRELEAKLAGGKSGGDGGASQGDPAVMALQGQIEAMGQMLRQATLSPVANTLRGEFDLAAEFGIFDDIDGFESPEAMRAAGESTQAKLKGIVDARVSAAVDEALGKVAAEHGIRLTPAPVDGGDAPAGDPTIEDIARGGLAALPEDDVLDRALRSVN